MKKIKQAKRIENGRVDAYLEQMLRMHLFEEVVLEQNLKEYMIEPSKDLE